MSSDPEGTSAEVGFDLGSALLAISKLRENATAVSKLRLPKSGSNWGNSQTLAGFRKTFFDTMTYVGDAVSATEQFAKSMADNIEKHIHELDGANRAAAEEILQILREMESTQVDENLSGIGATSAPAPTRSAPGNRSDIAAIMRGDSSGLPGSDGTS